MNPAKHYGFLCVISGGGDTLYLAPHGPGQYQLIPGRTGAALFEKDIASEIMTDNPDFFYVPVNVNRDNLTNIKNPDEWIQMNAPKSQEQHQKNNL